MITITAATRFADLAHEQEAWATMPSGRRKKVTVFRREGSVNQWGVETLARLSLSFIRGSYWSDFAHVGWDDGGYFVTAGFYSPKTYVETMADYAQADAASLRGMVDGAACAGMAARYLPRAA